jgi:hypothetical protein
MIYDYSWQTFRSLKLPILASENAKIHIGMTVALSRSRSYALEHSFSSANTEILEKSAARRNTRLPGSMNDRSPFS